MEPLQRPGMLDEACGQIVEQFRMRRFFPLYAEVAGSSHERLSHVPGPDAIDNDPRGERRRIAEDSLCQLPAARPLLKDWIALRQDGRKMPWNDIAGRGEIACLQNWHVA